MKQVFYDAEIIHIIDESEAVKRFFFRMPHLEKFHFKPGQFVMVNLPIESKISYRSYSIASAPGNDNVFELIIVLNPPGLGTPYMWENYKVGMTVPVAGPIGKFTLPEKLEHDLCLIATGTGIAPLRSMLHHVINNDIEHHNIYMVFGSRYEKDLLYKQEMNMFQEQHEKFRFIPVLSREDASTWNGRTGYVHSVYEEIFADKRPASFYLCGWKNMILEARDRLTVMGYTKEHIKFELYD
jgi:CDP-4-dehydro-6-deoxyglucose reductase